MSIGMLLALNLNKNKSIHKIEFYISCLSFLITISLSGSRNAWFILLLGIFLAWLYKIIKLRDACIVIALFMLSILSFSNSTQRAGIKESSFFPLSNIFKENNEKFDMNSILKNGSFEVWSYAVAKAPAHWRFDGRNRPFPTMNLIRDAKDGIFSVQIKNNQKRISLRQQISKELWHYLYDNFHELEFRSWAKTKSASVAIGLYLSNDKLLVSDPHPGDGAWHELILRVKMSEFAQKTRPTLANLIIIDPDTEVKFDNAVLKGVGANEHASDIEAPGREFNLNNEDIRLTTPSSSFKTRKRIWQATIKEILKRPVTGSGMQTFSVKSKQAIGYSYLHTHNIFLNILFDLGITGFLLSVIFIYSLLKKAKWDSPIAMIPVILVFSGQLIACYIHDFTYTALLLYFLAEAGNSKIRS